jgi:hypothetical protein
MDCVGDIIPGSSDCSFFHHKEMILINEYSRSQGAAVFVNKYSPSRLKRVVILKQLFFNKFLNSCISISGITKQVYA